MRGQRFQRCSLIFEYRVTNLLNIFYSDTYKYHIKKEKKHEYDLMLVFPFYIIQIKWFLIFVEHTWTQISLVLCISASWVLILCAFLNLLLIKSSCPSNYGQSITATGAHKQSQVRKNGLQSFHRFEQETKSYAWHSSKWIKIFSSEKICAFLLEFGIFWMRFRNLFFMQSCVNIKYLRLSDIFVEFC